MTGFPLFAALGGAKLTGFARVPARRGTGLALDFLPAKFLN